MRKVNLRMNAQEKYEVIKNLAEKNGNKLRDADKLNYNLRTIYRLIKKYNEKGKSDFVHGNQNKMPIKTIDKEVYQLKELSRNERFSKDFDEIIIEKKKRKDIPLMSHPWKLTTFKKHIEKTHATNAYA